MPKAKDTATPRLMVFTETKDPTATSSVVDRKHRQYRRTHAPLRATSAKGKHKIYIAPCDSHEDALTITAEVVYFSPATKKRVSCGTAKICFFCHSILTEPSNGWYTISDEEMDILLELKRVNQVRAKKGMKPVLGVSQGRMKTRRSAPVEPVVRPSSRMDREPPAWADNGWDD